MRNPIPILFLLLAPLVALSQTWQWSVPVEGGKTNADAGAWLWIPPGCKKVKAVIVAQNNMEEISILENPSFRKQMAALSFAEIWISPAFDHMFRFTDGAGEIFNSMMQRLSEASGYTELNESPIVPIGHSAAASWPYYFAAWNPRRTLACLSVSGQWPYFRHPSFAPDIWNKDQQIDFIPSLETMGEYEAADTWSAEGLKERTDHPFMPLSMLACPGEGHFAATQKKIDYLALYITKAAQYRLPVNDVFEGPPVLRAIDPTRTGWLMDKWRYNQQPTASPAPVGHYKGDTTTAFWFFDEALVRATENYEASYRNQQPLLLGYIQDGKMAPQHNTHLQVSLRWLPLADGISFVLKGGFLDTVPGESPRPASWSGKKPGAPVTHPVQTNKIRIDRVAGPFRKINDTLFQLALSKGRSKAQRNYPLTFIATWPGDGQYKPAAQQAELIVPLENTEGQQQQISFPAIGDQPVTATHLQLNATASSGLPVHYYVVSGPAIVDGDQLYLTPIPPRSRWPVKVTVAAWQYGRSLEPKVRTATPVQQTFFISKN